MTDKKWQKVINDCRKAGDLHKNLLKLAEVEYVNRYGHTPSEVDDDWWIDTLHYCTGDTFLEDIIKSAQQHKENADKHKLRNDR
jgi:hypothetical protein